MILTEAELAGVLKQRDELKQIDEELDALARACGLGEVDLERAKHYYAEHIIRHGHGLALNKLEARAFFCGWRDGVQVIRFCDLREAYWCDDGNEPPASDPPRKGPFAFIDTVKDAFVAMGEENLFDDAEHFEECVRVDLVGGGPFTEEQSAFVARLRGHIPGWAK